MSETPPPPVRVQFNGLYRPDIALLNESLIPYGRWSEAHIAALLPVAVTLPAKISQRLDVLKGYLVEDGWPPQVPLNARQFVGDAVYQMIPIVQDDIASGIRLMAASAIRDDGSRDVAIRDQVLSSFLASKMLSTARALTNFVLEGEIPLDWGGEFDGLPQIYSNDIIQGLSFLADKSHGWAGWTDADLWVGERDNRFRLFVPICPKPGDANDVYSLSAEEVQQLIIPQLLESSRSDQLVCASIRRLAFEPWASLSHGLVVRNEVFVDTETFTASYGAKAKIASISADRTAIWLQRFPPNERRRQFLKMERSLEPVSSEVEIIIEKMAIFDS
ncbi:hypothetical protein [Mesorhizobium sp. M0589]|uniref:hypothetical protein n=1 Tax=Mesorhizobium sp. M0589 TaxID=2956965 RepID=UPI00333BCB67